MYKLPRVSALVVFKDIGTTWLKANTLMSASATCTLQKFELIALMRRSNISSLSDDKTRPISTVISVKGFAK